MNRQHHSSGAPWEPIVGYSRALRVDNAIFVSGTTATDGQGGIVGESDPRAQTLQALKNIESALKALGSGRGQVVRTRMFVTDITQWEAIGRTHGEFFKSTRPATTMVQVAKLIDPRMLVEIEADAIIDPAD